MSILVINGSPNKNGNTMRLAQMLLKEKAYHTVHLVDYKLYGYGQQFADDQLMEVVTKMRAAQTIVIGSPLYWHNMSGMLRNLLDRFYGSIASGSFQGKMLIFLLQGAAPQAWMLEQSEYTMRRFAERYGMKYVGMAVNEKQAGELSGQIA